MAREPVGVEERGAGPGAGDVAKAVDRVRQAAGRAELRSAMAGLESVAAGPEGRAALRAELGPARYAQLAAEVVPFFPDEHDREACFRHLQELVFGRDRDDLHDDVVFDFAVDVLETRPPPGLGVNVLADLMRVREPELVQRRLAERWLDDRGLLEFVLPVPPDGTAGADAAGAGPSAAGPSTAGPSAADRPADPPPDQHRETRARPRVRPPAVRRRRRAWVLPAAVLGLVLLLLGVLAVMALRAFGSLPTAEEAAAAPQETTAAPSPPVAGTSAAPSPPAAAAPPPAPPPVPPEAVPAARPTVSGTVAQRTLAVRLPVAAANLPAVSLVLHPRGGTAYYYRGQCRRDDAAAEWVCREQLDLAAVPRDGAGYDVLVVSRIGELTQDAELRAVVPQPAPADTVAAPVTVAS